MSDSFRFKQFEVLQSHCAMKVGTDGVLLGAWCEPRGRVLDVGTGSGVVALMAAQRGAEHIDAVEIDSAACRQAAENFKLSPWKDRFEAIEMPFMDYAKACSDKYDTILSNPPYFINSLKCEQQSRLAARHTDLLPYEDLAKGVAMLLKDRGRFFAIFPYEEANIFIAIAASEGIFLNRRMDIRPIVGRPIKRVLLELSRDRVQDIATSELIIASDGQRNYTERYRELTKDFYLKF